MDGVKKQHIWDIRIGTLAAGGPGTDGYIRQILPYGFESFSITFWQTVEGTDLKELAKKVNGALEGSGAVISSLGIYGNPLEDTPKDRETLEGWRRCIDGAHLFGCDIVAGFAGRLRGKRIDESMATFKTVFSELAKRARDQGARLAFENCNMDGTWERGDWNIAHGPAAWEMMFDALPFDNVGLQWEPCHQMVALIDPVAQLRKWARKILHIHGKDCTINWDVIREHGIYGPRKFAFHRTPGFGDSNWTDIISELRRAEFKGSIDIEGWHDPVYCGELEMTGQVHALEHLKYCRGGVFAPNPK